MKAFVLLVATLTASERVPPPAPGGALGEAAPVAAFWIVDVSTVQPSLVFDSNLHAPQAGTPTTGFAHESVVTPAAQARLHWFLTQLTIWYDESDEQHTLPHFRFAPQATSQPDAVQVDMPLGTAPQLVLQLKQCAGSVARL